MWLCTVQKQQQQSKKKRTCCKSDNRHAIMTPKTTINTDHATKTTINSRTEYKQSNNEHAVIIHRTTNKHLVLLRKTTVKRM